MKLKYQARKIKEYVLEPRFGRDHAWWEAHHVTNPAVIRLSGDPRVFLGYRAGGDRDHYIINDVDVYSSSLGLAILGENADRVLYRFSQPIMRISHDFSLPQTPPEYGNFVNRKESEVISVLHDFRFYEHNDYLYVIYHDGRVMMARDVIARMPVKDFLAKIGQSILIEEKLKEGEATQRELLGDWAAIWWHDGIWEPCGIEDERLVFPMVNGRYSTKTDIVYYDLKDNMQMMRRPIPDISVLNVSDNLCGYNTLDGNQEMGVLEQCIRPGFFDNSHIGPNGMPTKAFIGNREVYIDICHGVHNRALSEDMKFSYAMTYLPYFRIKDANNGDVLYYSEEPIIDPDCDLWVEYTRRGRWISALEHEYILFAGGQTEVVQGKNNIDDKFVFFAGAGDTAVVQAEFSIKGLTPQEVLDDILLDEKLDKSRIAISKNEYELSENPAGWHWAIENNKLRINIIRDLNGKYEARRIIHTRPGYFDSTALWFDGQSIMLYEGVGYVLCYTGLRWSVKNNKQYTQVGRGIILLDDQNPERLLYRSVKPIDELKIYDGHVGNIVGSIALDRIDMKEALAHIPAKTIFEIKRGRELEGQGLHWKSHHTQWLEDRANAKGGA